jgi:light-regulated signal transduction histidine kinase (bacteriophytochrome)
LSRILLLLENPENRRLLADILERRHELAVTPAPDIPFDLVIVDGASLKSHGEYLLIRKQEEDPVFLPVLLATPRQAVGLFSGPLFRLVDEVVVTPVEKVELIARVEMLLRARRLSLELRLRKDDVEAFIHAMTHDLRAPLRTVTGFAEAMAEDQSSRLDAAGKHQLDRIQVAARQMWELIESLVEFSRIGRKSIKLRSVDLDQLVRLCVDEMRSDVEAHKATVHIRGELGTVEADPALLKIAIHNLISNGIKYVKPEVAPHIEVWTERHGHSTCLMFRDNGIGLSAEDQQRIFAPFVRLHGVEDYPGVGLGLSATKRVVEIIGGQIGVSSMLGNGSTFWIELMAGGAQ